MLQLSIEYPRYSRLHFNSDDYFTVVINKIDKTFNPSYSYRSLYVPVSEPEAEHYMQEGFLVAAPGVDFPNYFITVKVLSVTFSIPSGDTSSEQDVINYILDLYKTNASKYIISKTTELNQQITL